MKLIIPSPYLKKIIDNTAEFVFKHGKNFMILIKKKYEKNKIFGFLEKNNIFYGYFIYRLNSILEKKSSKFKSKKNKFSKTKCKSFNVVMKIKKMKIFSMNRSFITNKKLVLSAHFINYNDLNIISFLIKELLSNGNAENISFSLKNLFMIQSRFSDIINNMQIFLDTFFEIYFHINEIIDNDYIKKNIERYKTLFDPKKTYFLKESNVSYEWKLFNLVETIDFFDFELTYLASPISKKDLL
mmetsp:Transcript_32050/g.44689  ORF Transcript_32050/g.44689 Transcript_32050/m.44689 type:complete len:242 (-) Transcript_32050:1338-2063(-)